jgi:hypothetical protein
MTMLAERTTFEAPAPLDQATDVGAWVNSGRRQIVWTILTPGTFARNGFAMAWVTVTEELPFRGEPLTVTAERRVDGDGPRGWFTEAGMKALRATVLPAVARYGFDRLWTELNRNRHGADVDRTIREAEAKLVWYRDRKALVEMHEAGLVTFDRQGFHEGLATTVAERDTPGIQRTVEYEGRLGWTHVMARAVVDGEQVGWMDTGGGLIPMGDVLDV